MEDEFLNDFNLNHIKRDKETCRNIGKWLSIQSVVALIVLLFRIYDTITINTSFYLLVGEILGCHAGVMLLYYWFARREQKEIITVATAFPV